MKKINHPQSGARREFLGKLAAGATALGLSSVLAPFNLRAKPATPVSAPGSADEWFAKIKGKHRILFDVTAPHGVLPFAWPKVFLLTNEATGTPTADCGVVVILRHEAIPFAMESRLWEKYKFGEVFKIDDDTTKKPSIRNAFWQPKPGDFQIPGVGNVQIGINELQANGVMFGVCNMAMTVYSAVIAKQMNADAATVKKDFDAGILPGIQVVPSGVLAVNRAQENGCSYCFAGG